jgi:CubicO group peptidase (beta-lactamase class C family)
VTASTPQTPSSGSAARSAVDAAHDRLVAIGHVDPVVALLAPDGRVVSGDPRERFEIGSVTKVFTATLLAVLADEGTVAIRDPVPRWLPEGTPTAPGVSRVTLENLASHRSGLPRLPPGALRASFRRGGTRDPYASIDEATLLASLSRTKVRGTPGETRVRYSNYGAGLLGYLLGRAAGSDYPTALTARVLQPLGMDATDFADSPLHQGRSRGKPVGPWHLSELAGAGALRSNAHDMLRWLDAVRDPPDWLARPAAEMRAPRGRMGPASVGLGWFIYGGPLGVLTHDGGTLGARSQVRLDVESGIGVVVLADARRGTAAAADGVLRTLSTGASHARSTEPGKQPRT